MKTSKNEDNYYFAPFTEQRKEIREEYQSKFMKPTTEYLEAFYEIVANFYLHTHSKVLEEIETTKGRGGMWEFAESLTDEFMEKYKDFEWDGEFFDKIDEFLKNKL
ncbi:MAG: hypothetical protein ACRCX2_09670 [Paraclostridium sp.]